MSRAGVRTWLLATCLVACAHPHESTQPPEHTRPRQPGPLISDPAEYAIERPSAEAGERIFTRTGIGDPYGTGVPFPVFLALLEAYPEELGPDLGTFGDRFGFLARTPDTTADDPDLEAGLPVGMHITHDPFTGVAFLVTNCTLCHAERVQAAGIDQIVVGLGNKRVRVHAYDRAWSNLGNRPELTTEQLAPRVARIAAERGLRWPARWATPFLEASVNALRERARVRAALIARVGDGAPGLVAVIESFALAMGRTLGRDVPTGERVGWAKVPDVIGYRHRATLSFDAAGVGPKDALVVEADFATGARLEWFWSHPQQGASLSRFLNQLQRDLPFPGSIDHARAERGQLAFTNSCSPCHGDYGPDGHAVRYEERVIPLAHVGSDSSRAEAVSAAYVEAGNDPRLTHGLVHVRRTMGYVAPVLTDLWLRAPYGHAGQWSSLAVLAQPPDERSSHFVMDLSGQLDLARVGVPVRAEGSGNLQRGECSYDASAPGRSVLGHPFLADLPPRTREDVLEYLKTL